MSDTVDTSAEAVERDVLALSNLAHHLTRFDSASGDAALMLRVAATMRRLRHERDEARADAARFLADANRYAAERLVRDLEIEGLAALFEQGNNADRGCPTPGVRRLIARLREHRQHQPGPALRDVLDTAAATLERQADTIAATRCDCAERSTPYPLVEKEAGR